MLYDPAAQYLEQLLQNQGVGGRVAAYFSTRHARPRLALFSIPGWADPPRLEHQLPLRQDLPDTIFDELFSTSEPGCRVCTADEHPFSFGSDELWLHDVPVVVDGRDRGDRLVLFERKYEGTSSTQAPVLTTLNRPVRISDRTLHSNNFVGAEQLTLADDRPPALSPGLPHPPDARALHVIAHIASGTYDGDEQTPVLPAATRPSDLERHRTKYIRTMEYFSDFCSTAVSARAPCMGVADSQPVCLDPGATILDLRTISNDPAILSAMAAQRLARNEPVYVCDLRDSTEPMLRSCRGGSMPGPEDVDFETATNITDNALIIVRGTSALVSYHSFAPLQDQPVEATLCTVGAFGEAFVEQADLSLRETLPGWYRARDPQGYLRPETDHIQVPLPDETSGFEDHPGLIEQPETVPERLLV